MDVEQEDCISEVKWKTETFRVLRCNLIPMSSTIIDRVVRFALNVMFIESIEIS